MHSQQRRSVETESIALNPGTQKQRRPRRPPFNSLQFNRAGSVVGMELAHLVNVFFVLAAADEFRRQHG